jgi:hypothetical protein
MYVVVWILGEFRAEAAGLAAADKAPEDEINLVERCMLWFGFLENFMPNQPRLLKRKLMLKDFIC